MSVGTDPKGRLKSNRLKKFNQGLSAATLTGVCGSVVARWFDLVNRTGSTNKFYSDHTGVLGVGLIGTSARRLRRPQESPFYSIKMDNLAMVFGEDIKTLSIARLKKMGCKMVKFSITGVWGKPTATHALGYHDHLDLIFDPNFGEWKASDLVLQDLVAYYTPTSVALTPFHSIVKVIPCTSDDWVMVEEKDY